MELSDCCPSCGKEVQGYLHEAPDGCGLVNSIWMATAHVHFYCCQAEWTKDGGGNHEV